MNTTFSFYRLGLLLNRFFVENKQKELTFWAIAIVVFMLMYNAASVGMFIIIAGFIFASRIYKSFGYTPGGMHYLLIPATHLEKLVSGIILSTIYFLIGVLISYMLGNTIGTHLGNLIFGTNNEVNLQLFDFSNKMQYMDSGTIYPYIDMFIGFAIVQSIFLLGSIYFKRNPIGKTFLAIIAFSVVIGLFEVFLLKLNFDITSLQHENININILDLKSMFPGAETFGQIIKFSIAPFFWVVSYFRLTEKEV
ncbi:MAG TPA: hypothetical protein P5084_12695 [Paludibacter sp.]|nr:hypothetical protein [Paludibacter sp.]